MENEIWRDIEGFENYQVSNLGLIRSKSCYVKHGDRKRLQKGKVLKQCLDGKGYFVLNISNSNGRQLQRVHRLIAQAFVPNPETKPCVNHKNGIKTDNRIENFEWVTAKENVIHAFSNGLMNHVFGERCHNVKLNEGQVVEIKKMLYSKYTMPEIANVFNVSPGAISAIKHNRTWKHVIYDNGG